MIKYENLRKQVLDAILEAVEQGLITGTSGNSNEVTLTYNNGPASETTATPPEVNVYSFNIQIEKFTKEAGTSSGSPLQGAEFELYADADLTEQIKTGVLAAIESYSKENLDQCINQIYSEFLLREDQDYSLCYEKAESLIQFFFEHTEKQEEELKEMRKELLSNCQHCYTIRELKHLLKTSLGDYLEASRAAMEAESARPIRQALQYIEDHYAEKLTLEELADIVELNAVYFSVLFKKETGINFSSYLVNVRMEKAKEILCSTNETIAAVAESVGYKDSRYFSQVFTKTVGIKPALYRKLHS